MTAVASLFDEIPNSDQAGAASALMGPTCPASPIPPLPVFNPLSCDGGRCQSCKIRQQRWYLACRTKTGGYLPNRFVCDACRPAAESEARAAGKFELFEVCTQ